VGYMQSRSKQSASLQLKRSKLDLGPALGVAQCSGQVFIAVWMVAYHVACFFYFC